MQPFPLNPDRHNYRNMDRDHPILKKFTVGEVENVLFPVLWDRFTNEEYWEMNITEFTRSMREKFNEPRITRQTLNSLIHYGVTSGVIRFSPRRNFVEQNKLMQFANAGQVTVVDVYDDERGIQFASAGAELVLELIRDVQCTKPGPVHLGLPPGAKCERLVRELASLLDNYLDAPDLVVHALTPPHAVGRPDQTPLAWLGLLKGTRCGEVEWINLPAEPICATGKRPSDSGCADVRRAYERIDELDIVVTSMASYGDPHGHLSRHLESEDFNATARELQRKSWVGEVLLQPYSATGPIEIEEGPKPVTLLGLKDLARIAHTPNKKVVLLCGPCADKSCKKKKTNALLPLLEVSQLGVWTHLVVDYEISRTVNPPSLNAGNAGRSAGLA